MPANINPQEVYLLQRYTSVEYFCELRDTWEALVLHVDSCLDQFMRALPPDYRSRPLPEQPDIVWGQRVLPNFRSTLQSLYTGVILLSHGDFSAFKHAHGPTGDFKGQLDYWSAWMSEADEGHYGELLTKAVAMASNITSTDGAHWDPTNLTTEYQANSRGPLNPPSSWPVYQTNPRISVASGAKTMVAGIYVPDVENSCAQFLNPAYPQCPPAIVQVGTKELFAPDTGIKYGEQAEFETRPCVWHKVEQIAASGGLVPAQGLLPEKNVRIAGGQLCTEPGYYFTPSRAGSRQWFEGSEIMSDFNANYGATIWQWDQNQS
jgi:hypothetical protein